MYTLSITLVVCLAAAAYGFPGTQIVGGKEAPVGKFPYQVSLKKNGNHFCGGSIIDERTILTAAHCVDGQTNLKAITVNAGSNVLSQKGAVYEVEKITVHPKYNAYLIVNDVAVIRVTKNIAFNSNVKAVKLASQSVSYEGSDCILSGWGTLKNGGNVPDKLQYINLKVESQSKCKQTHWQLKESHICTFTKYGEGACHGDSGGPLVANNVQIGIVSFGRPCGVGSPDVYTRVSSFLPWIQQHQKSLEQEEPEADVVATLDEA